MASATLARAMHSRLPVDLRQYRAIIRRMSPEAVNLRPPLGALPDVELADLYYSGSEAAFAELYQRHFRHLVVLFRRLGSSDEAEDLAEETFLRFVQTKETGKSRFEAVHGVAFTTWLFRIALNLRSDRWRRRGNVNVVNEMSEVGDEDVSLAESAADLDPSSEELLQMKELPSVLRECFEEVPQELRLRLVLWLRIRGHKQQEIAEVLRGCTRELQQSLNIESQYSTSTVNRDLRRAFDQIKSWLNAKGFEFVPRIREGDLSLPEIVMRFDDELLVYAPSESRGVDL